MAFLHCSRLVSGLQQLRLFIVHKLSLCIKKERRKNCERIGPSVQSKRRHVLFVEVGSFSFDLIVHLPTSHIGWL